MIGDPGEAPTEHVPVAVVGTGFAGIGASIALQRAGIDHVVLERAGNVGGTWRDNTYPGCRCDVPSHLYSFSFAPNPDWSETYSPQPEIWSYLRDTAERHGVVERTRFGQEVYEAQWDAAGQRWLLQTARGQLSAGVVVLGHGPLAEPAMPDVPGLDRFHGPVWHSARWPAGVDLTGQRVAVVGTGASAVQIIPEIQPHVARLSVFQRTPAWVLPHTNRRITSAERTLYRRVPAAQRFVRGLVYWSRELFATCLLRNGRFLRRLRELGRRQLEAIPDPELRARLTPDFEPGCKRLLLSNDYYPALANPNVDVVTEKIVEVVSDGIVTADGVRHAVDTIVLATGFRVTDNPVAQRIIGADGRTLAEHWDRCGAQAYLGSTVPAFPNLFLLAGPNTGIGHTSLVVMIEAQLAYVTDALRVMREQQLSSVDLRPAAWESWIAEVQRKARPTVWNSGGCASWYLDAEGRNTTIWPDYTFRFRRRTRRFDARQYAATRHGAAAGTTGREGVA